MSSFVGSDKVEEEDLNIEEIDDLEEERKPKLPEVADTVGQPAPLEHKELSKEEEYAISNGEKESLQAVKIPQGVDLVGQNTIDIGREFAAFRTCAKDEEEAKHANFPKNLHSAMELFCMMGLGKQAWQCKTDVETYLTIMSTEGPNALNTHELGRAIICWQCGHAGLPANQANLVPGSKLPGMCKLCKNIVQTNFFYATEPDGKEIPWVEAYLNQNDHSKEAQEARARVPSNVNVVRSSSSSSYSNSNSNNNTSSSTSNISSSNENKNNRIKPNDRCPCHSGKKFKKCCGGLVK